MQFVGKVAYHDFGGVADEEEEMEEVGKAAASADVVVLRNHGILVMGEDVETAFSRLYYYERSCQTQLLVMVRICSRVRPLSAARLIVQHAAGACIVRAATRMHARRELQALQHACIPGVHRERCSTHACLAGC
jgi:hypothetical protein